MSTITLKNVSPAIHKTLKSRAKANGRSLNREILVTLENTFHASSIDTASISNRARAVRETMGVYLTQDDLTSLKNAGRK